MIRKVRGSPNIPFRNFSKEKKSKWTQNEVQIPVYQLNVTPKFIYFFPRWIRQSIYSNFHSFLFLISASNTLGQNGKPKIINQWSDPSTRKKHEIQIYSDSAAKYFNRKKKIGNNVMTVFISWPHYQIGRVFDGFLEIEQSSSVASIYSMVTKITKFHICKLKEWIFNWKTYLR